MGQVVRNVEKVVAIELLAACQAIEFLRPLKTTQPLEEVYKVVRSVVAPWDRDRYMSPDIEAAGKLLKEGRSGKQRAATWRATTTVSLLRLGSSPRRRSPRAGSCRHLACHARGRTRCRMM